MGLYIVKGNLPQRIVDAVVCTANENLHVGGALGHEMMEFGGYEIFEDAKRIGHCDVGSSVILPGHNLKAKYIIHSVGPIYKSGSREEIKLLKNAYTSALQLAVDNKLESIEFPLISTGSFGFPKQLGCKVALSAIREFLKEHDLSVGIVINSNDTFKELADILHQYKVYDGIGYQEFVTPTFTNDACALPRFKDEFRGNEKCGSIKAKPKKGVPKKPIGYEYIKENENKTSNRFQNTNTSTFGFVTLNSIDFTKKEDPKFLNVFNKYVKRCFDNKLYTKNSQLYNAANVSRSVFSKIYCNKGYVPTKLNIYAFAVALKLNRLETKELLESGDYAMRDNDTLDYVMGQILDCGKYDIFQVNNMLYEHNLPYLAV